MEKWRGKIAVVTGCSSEGIGKAVVRDLVAAGMIVIGLARRVEKIEEYKPTLAELPGKLHARQCDVSNPESVRETFAWILKEYGKLNVLVSVSGIARHKLAIFDDNPENFAQLQQIVNTNFTGLLQCSQEAFKIMKSQDDYGIIINMGSVLGHQIPYLDGINLNVYPATKFAVTALTETMRQEIVMMKNEKIRVASISPGVVETEIRKASGLHSEANDYSSKPRLKPEDISQLVIFILSTPVTVNINDIVVRHIGDPF